MFKKEDLDGKNVVELLEVVYRNADIINLTGSLEFNELMKTIGLIDFVKLFYIHSNTMIPEELLKAEHIIRMYEMNIDRNIGKAR